MDKTIANHALFCLFRDIFIHFLIHNRQIKRCTKNFVQHHSIEFCEFCVHIVTVDACQKYVDHVIKYIPKCISGLWTDTLLTFSNYSHRYVPLILNSVSRQVNFITCKMRSFTIVILCLVVYTVSGAAIVSQDELTTESAIDNQQSSVNNEAEELLKTIDDLLKEINNAKIRGTSFKDEHIKQLILILPKLTLIFTNKSYGVTQEAADHVQDYCKRYGRSIKFYFKKDDKQIESDWPQILNRPEKVCRGFDFMEHCFFKNFYESLNFLDPVDNQK
uniref:Uncharacterized protein n=1 Tax=Tetranychus urticae TaxID=32264 RepID=T1K4F2_TETUR